MKKYVKPALYCERFQLTEMIAGNCDILCDFKGGSCKTDVANSDYYPSLPLFSYGDTACNKQISIGDAETIYNGYCYWPADSGSTTLLGS